MQLDVQLSQPRLDVQMVRDALALQAGTAAAIRRQTTETKGLMRADVASSLGGRAAMTVYSQVGPDKRIGVGEDGSVIGVVSSRWWAKRGGRWVNVLDGFETGMTIRPTKGRYLAIPLPAAGKARDGGRITPEEWEERHNQDLILVQRPGRPALLVARASRIGSSGLAVTSVRRTKKGRSVANRVMVPLFVLVGSTRLPKRLNARRIRETTDQGLILKIVEEARRRGFGA